MARPPRPWFRFYVEAVSDPKIRQLSPAQRWLWVAILAAARMSPEPGLLLISRLSSHDLRSISDLAAVDLRTVRRGITALINAGMLEVTADGNTWAVVNWNERQYESDNTTERTRRHRSNHPERDTNGTFQTHSQERSGNVEGTVLGTMTEAEADTEVKASATVTNDDPVENPRPAALISQALNLIVDRRITRNGHIGNPARYRQAAVEGLRRDLTLQLSAVKADCPMSPAALADFLEPTPKESRPALRDERPDCETCGASGWTDNELGQAVRCKTCNQPNQPDLTIASEASHSPPQASKPVSAPV